MSRLIRLGFLLVLLFTALITAERVIHGVNSDPLITLFTEPAGVSCLPTCLLGVYPRETTYDEAIALLKVHPFIRELSEYGDNFKGFFAFGGSAGMTVFFTKSDDGRVSQITITFFTDKLTRAKAILGNLSIGALTRLVGPPTLIVFHEGVASYFYQEIKMRVKSISAAPFRCTPNDELISIALEQTDEFAKDLDGFRQDTMPWQGFADYSQQSRPCLGIHLQHFNTHAIFEFGSIPILVY